MEAFEKIRDKVQNLEESKITVQEWQKENQKVVFTNGCFDLLHMGHIDYLSKAKDLGAKLIVGVNSSESVSKLKGPSRPINSTESRATMLAAFEFIDLVIIFNDETPLTLISNLVPNILVKGGDYSFETIVGAKTVVEYGGEVKVIPFLKGYSTTNIVTKIQSFSKT